MLGKRRLDPRCEIAAVRLVVSMLELAPAAFGEVPAWRILVMRAGRKRSIVEQHVARNAERNMAAG